MCPQECVLDFAVVNVSKTPSVARCCSKRELITDAGSAKSAAGFIGPPSADTPHHLFPVTPPRSDVKTMFFPSLVHIRSPKRFPSEVSRRTPPPRRGTVKTSRTRRVEALINATLVPSGDTVGYSRSTTLESGAARHRFCRVANVNTAIPREPPGVQASEKTRDWPSGVQAAWASPNHMQCP
jgi:hypothetical protein